MIIAAVFILSLASAQLAGGDVRRLAHVRLRGSGAAFAALAIQVLVITVAPGGDATLHAVVHVGTYAAAGWFLWINRGLPFFRLIAAGGALNLAAIVANGGIMPSTHSALATAGLLSETGDFLNSTALDHPHLLGLGDVFAIPASWPLANVFSIGDVLIALAGLFAVHHLSDSRLAFWLDTPRADRPLGMRLDRAAGRGWRPAYGELRSVVADGLGLDASFYTAEIEPHWDAADASLRRQCALSFRKLASEAGLGHDLPPELAALLCIKADVLEWAVARDTA
jgi:hypothetical protein